jgi:hypothetical protein
MKMMIAAAAALSLIASPAMAGNRGYRHEEHHGGGWVLPLLGGLVIGGIIASDHDRNHEYHPEYEAPRHNPEPQPRYFYGDGMRCVDTPHVRYDQDGYQYYVWERFCQ